MVDHPNAAAPIKSLKNKGKDAFKLTQIKVLMQIGKMQ
jgi:hypothetical protein